MAMTFNFYSPNKINIYSCYLNLNKTTGIKTSKQHESDIQLPIMYINIFLNFQDKKYIENRK